MYEYLVENLISYSQVDGNLRRTADRGLVSELYRRQMNALALKYFGVDSNGNYTENKEDIVAYRCPYSGEIISDLSTAHLEHILPVSSNGGTVLFNCIPILDKVNLSKRDEANLLVWWQEQNYFNYDRLERLIQYMLEAYTLAFKEPTEEELYDYDNSLNSDDYIENDDLSIDLKDKTSNQTNINIQQTITYYQLINDLINELSKNRDVSKYNSQLNSLKEQNTFGNIDELEKVINAVQTVFKEILGESSKSYLSYSLKIDMNKLLKSLNTNNYKEEINERIIYIKSIIGENNISINDYFDNLQDLEDINLIYYDINRISNIQKQNFINSIKIGHSSKVKIFLDMLKYARTKEDIASILESRSLETFKTYKKDDNSQMVVDKEYGKIGFFWNNNRNELLQIIYNDDKYIQIREKLDEYYMMSLSGQQSIEGSNRRKQIFLDMLKYAKTKEDIASILESRSSEMFKTYKKDENGNVVVDKEYGKIGSFWQRYKDGLYLRIYNDDKYIQIREKLDEYYMMTYSGQQSVEGNNRRKQIFLDMLKHAKTKEDIASILKYKSPEMFKTYKHNENGQIVVDKEYGEIDRFWSTHHDELLHIIYNDNKYIQIREKLDEYYMMTLSGQQSVEGNNRRKQIFLDMLKYANGDEEVYEILKFNSKEKFKTYKRDETGAIIVDNEYGQISHFWNKNKYTAILPELFYSQEYASEEYDIARKNVMNYLNLQRKKKKQPEFKNIDEYIDTLDKTKKEVKALIELRDSLLLRKKQLIIENQELTEELNSSYRRAM